MLPVRAGFSAARTEAPVQWSCGRYRKIPATAATAGLCLRLRCGVSGCDVPGVPPANSPGVPRRHARLLASLRIECCRTAWDGGRQPSRALPDLHPLIGREVQLLARRHVERGVPRIEVAHGFCAEVRGRVHVGGQLLAQRGVAGLVAPRLSEREEETLSPVRPSI